MTHGDRLNDLERRVSEVTRDTRGQWIRPAGGGGGEEFRLIRGQCVGAVTGANTTFLIDNVIVLSGGLDPSDGDMGAQVSIANIFAQSYSDNDLVQAVYSPDVVVSPQTDWEQFKTTGTATEKYRAIRGLAKGAVTAQATSFTADNIVPWANGLDPVSGNPATEVTIQKTQKEAFADNAPFFAIHDGTNWILAIVERYRAIRGLATSSVSSSTSSFSIDNLYVLDSGLDPRSDPTSSTETVTVYNVPGNTYDNDGHVIADWNVATGHWEVPPDARGASAKVVKITGTISARSGTTRGSGTAQPVNSSTLADDGGTITVYNLSRVAYVGSSSEPLYALASQVGADYFLHVFDTTSLPTWTLANDQSIGHDANILPAWQDDGDCT